MVPMAPSKVGMSQVSVVMQVHAYAGQSVFGGEATRDPAPTVYDPNDPKGKQQAIHKAESFAEYLAKREMQGAVIPTGGNVSPTPAPEALVPPTAAPPQTQEAIPQQGMTFADYMASRGEGAAVAAPPAPVDPAPQQGMTYADYMASRGEGAAPTAAAAPPAAVDPPTVPPIAPVSAPVAAPIAAPVQMSESELAAQRLRSRRRARMRLSRPFRTAPPSSSSTRTPGPTAAPPSSATSTRSACGTWCGCPTRPPAPRSPSPCPSSCRCVVPSSSRSEQI